MRKEDLREVEGRWIIRIVPDAGSVKVGDYRDVSLHAQVVDLGFVKFVEATNLGPLFHGGNAPDRYAIKAMRISNQISEWLQKLKLVPDGVRPIMNGGIASRRNAENLEYRTALQMPFRAMRDAQSATAMVTLLWQRGFLQQDQTLPKDRLALRKDCIILSSLRLTRLRNGLARLNEDTA